MTYRLAKRFKILILTALLAVATGIAAAPIRNAMSPLVTRPFSQWLDTAPGARTQTGPLLSPDLNRLSEPGESRLDATSPDNLGRSGAAGRGRRYEGDDARASRTGDGGPRGRGETGGWVVVGNGSSRGSGFVPFGFPGAGGIGAGTRPGTRHEGAAPAKADAKPGAAGAPAQHGGSGAGGPAAGGGQGNVASGPGAPAAPGSLFGDHNDGLDALTGVAATNPPLDPGTSFGATNVAVNPEPSTLFLFGTGIALVAGTVRRRLR